MILGFCYSNLRRETGGLELASTITLVLQANRLTKPFWSHSLLIRLIMLPVSQSPSKFFPSTKKFIIGRWRTRLASFRCCFGFSWVSMEMLQLRNAFSFSCFYKATMFSQTLKWATGDFIYTFSYLLPDKGNFVLDFFFCPEVFLNIHFVNVRLSHSKSNGCISNLLLCNFGICGGDAI